MTSEFQTKVVDNIKTHILCSINFLFFSPRKSCPLWDNMGKFCRAVRVTDEDTQWCMRIACRIPKATHTHTHTHNTHTTPHTHTPHTHTPHTHTHTTHTHTHTTHTHTSCNICFFSSARTRPSVTFYVHCLSC